MPKIPVYDGRQVTPGAGISARFSPVGTAEAFGAGVARGLQQLGQGISNVAQETAQWAVQQKQELDRSQVREALNRAREELRGYMFGDPSNPEATGLLYRRGKDATNIYQEASERLKEIKDRYSENLTGNPAIELYNQNMDSVLNSRLRMVAYAQARGREEYRQETLKGDILETMNDAAESIRTFLDTKMENPENILKQGFASEGASVIKSKAKALYNNLPIKQREEYARKAVTEYHAQNLEILRSRDPQAAKQYFEKHKKDMEPLVAAKLDEQITQEAREDELLGIAQDLDAMPLLKDRLAAIDVYRDADDYKVLSGMVVDRWRLQRLAAQEETSQIDKQAYDAWLKNPQMELPDNISPELRASLLSARDKMIKSGMRGTSTDFQVWNEQLNLLEEDPEKFATNWAKNWQKYVGKLSSADFNRLKGFADDIREGNDSPGASEYRTHQQIISGAVSVLNLGDSDTNIAKERLSRAYYAALQRGEFEGKDQQYMSDWCDLYLIRNDYMDQGDLPALHKKRPPAAAAAEDTDMWFDTPRGRVRGFPQKDRYGNIVAFWDTNWFKWNWEDDYMEPGEGVVPEYNKEFAPGVFAPPAMEKLGGDKKVAPEPDKPPLKIPPYRGY